MFNNFSNSSSLDYNYSSSSSPEVEEEEHSFHDLLPSADWLSMPPSSVLLDHTGTSAGDNWNTVLAYPSFQSAFDYTSSPSNAFWGQGNSFNMDTFGAPLSRTASTPSSLSSISDSGQSTPSSTATSPLVMPTEEEYRLYELARGGSNQGHFHSPANDAQEVVQQSPASTSTSVSPVAGPSMSSMPSGRAPNKKVVTRSSASVSKVISGDLSEKYWEAVLKRDGSGLSAFWYGVTSTKIYCRPSCASRRPMRTNVVFFESLDEADTAGYRPCKRCKPEDALEPSVVRQQTSVFQAAKLIEECIAAHQKPPSLTQLSAFVSMSPFYFQRTFKRIHGCSPKAYAMQLAKARASQQT